MDRREGNFILLYATDPMLIMYPLRGQFRQKIFFFIICFYAIIHRTIVQNKILSIICSCFFCLANIYRPSLRKVRLGRPNPKPIQPLNFYLRREKKTILSRIVCTTMVWSPIFNFDFNLFLKYLKMLFQKPVKNIQYIYIF